MEDNFYQDVIINPENVKDIIFLKSEFERCEFQSLNLLSLDLSMVIFQECIFINCDLSMAILNKTSFRKITFDDCKILGVRFDDCHPFLFSVSFKKCILDMSVFNALSLKKIFFSHCQLRETDFSDADMQDAVFDHCNLDLAIFENTNLSGADFITSFGYIIDPEINYVVKAKFSWPAAEGLLKKYRVFFE
ncbi:MAG: pentapeptide repeat-containing protein [Saprospiraceae bacterium]|nr:pentapeptide repeat-containing protein [Saprospiraceae bacterium]